MKTSKAGKTLSLVLAVIMLFTMIPATVFTLATGEDLPVIKKYTGITVSNKPDHHSYRENIVTATFTDSIDLSDAVMSWDVSDSADTGTVMSWLEINSKETQAAGGTEKYDLYIGGEGGVQANPVSTNFFYSFNALKEVRGLENFHTSGVTTFDCFFEECSSLTALDLRSFDTSSCSNFSYMFSGCKSLVSINLKGWDTSNATNMGFMFANCWVLPELDISSFNTKKVTYMKRMFYKCEKLTTLYMGDDWSVEQVSASNSGEMFNCCYAVKGQKSYDEVPAPYNKQYATTDYFLTYKAPEAPEEYKVTYEFIGEAPKGLAPPAEAKYEEGTEVTIADEPYAEGYIFSGWSTDDAAVTDNSFKINSDVHFVGSFDKLYKVEYRYTDGYEIPEGAPELPEAQYYEAGEWVDLFGVPYVYRHIFIGWTTDDADAAGDMFIMPEKDLILYGYYKIPVESVEFMTEEDTVTVNKDESIKINVYVNPEDATIKDIVYESDDESIVKVDKYGNITAVGEGTATVTVKSSDDPSKSDTVTIAVKLPVTEIKTDKTEITLNKNDRDKLTVSVNPEATNKEIEYTSSDESVVTVDKYGNIEAVGEGTATVTVTSKDNPEIKETVSVTVKIPVTEITAEEDFTINADEVKGLEAKVNEDATNKALIYESSNPGVAKVDNDGNVIGISSGTAIITVTSKDNPEVKKEITVTVRVPVEGITVEKNSFELEEDKTDKINASATPDGATDKELTYESSDEAVVTVDENGNITAVGEGTATVTITSKNDESIKETVTVTVKKPYIPVESITARDITLEIGETENLDVKISPDNATDKNLEFESCDESVAKVDKYGNVTAVSAGTAPILIIPNGDITKAVTVMVTVKPPVIYAESIKTDKAQISLEEGQTDKITVTVLPENTTDKNIIFVSDNEDVVTVDEKGNITALKEGTATVKVISSSNPSLYIELPVTVTAPEEPAEPEEPTEPEKPEYIIETPDALSLFKGEKKSLGIVITPDDGSIVPVFKSSDESVVKVDADGNITGVGVGIAVITADFGGGDVRLIPVTVLTVPTKHHVCFGKTDGIGWYEVSVNGGDFSPQGPNSTLEVYEGSVLVVRVQDMWIDDEFDFYVNGKKVPLDPGNTITVVVDGYMLIGALSMDVPVPDVEESLNIFQRILKAITDFFAMVKSWFTKK